MGTEAAVQRDCVIPPVVQHRQVMLVGLVPATACSWALEQVWVPFCLWGQTRQLSKLQQTNRTRLGCPPAYQERLGTKSAVQQDGDIR